MVFFAVFKKCMPCRVEETLDEWAAPDEMESNHDYQLAKRSMWWLYTKTQRPGLVELVVVKIH